MAAGITSEGKAAFVKAAFVDAQAAVFDGDTQVTEWAPYDLSGVGPHDLPPGVAAPRLLVMPVLEVRAADGTFIRFPIGSSVREGDTLHPAPLDQWLTDDDTHVDEMRF